MERDETGAYESASTAIWPATLLPHEQSLTEFNLSDGSATTTPVATDGHMLRPKIVM
jgi:hypothetical protein